MVSFYLLTFFLIFIFFDPQAIFTSLEPLRLAFVSGILVFLSISTRIIGNFFKEKQSPLFLLLFILAIISAYNSIETEISTKVLFFLLKCMLLYFSVITIIDTKKKFEKFTWILVSFASINILCTLSFSKVGIYEPDWRLKSFFGGEGSSSNGYAMMLASFLPLLFYLFDTKQSKATKGFLLSSILASVLGIIRTRSRMGLGAILMVASMILWEKRKKKSYIFLVLILIFIVTFFTHERTWERFDTISAELSSANFGGRTVGWKEAIEFMKKYPIFGSGLNTYLIEKKEQVLYDTSYDLEHVVHNSYLLIGSEMGVFAMLIYISIIFFSIIDLWKIEKKIMKQDDLVYHAMIKGIKSGLVVIATCLFFIPDPYSRLLYIYISISVSAISIYKTDSASEKPGIAIKK